MTEMHRLKEHFSKRFLGRSSKGGDRLPPTLTLICVVLLAAWMGAADGGYFVADWASPALVLTALLLLVSTIGFFGSTKTRWGVFALGLFAAYTAWTFASLLWSPNKGDAWLGAGQTLLYLIAFWVAVALVALGASRRWVLAASVLGPAVVAALTLQALGSRLEELFENNRLVGTVGYYNGEAAFLLIPFWVAVYLGASRRVNPVLRAAVLAGAVVSVDLAVLTQSRGAMVAMIVSLPVFFLLSGQRLRGLLALLPVAAALYAAFPSLNGVYLASLHGENPAVALEHALPIVWSTAAGAGVYGLSWGLFDRRWRVPRNAGRAAGSAALAGVVVVLIVGTPLLFERAGDPVAVAQQKWEAFKNSNTAGQEQSRYLSASGEGRYELWEVAWQDFVARPVLGVGTQNYEATYYQLREQGGGSVRQPHALALEVLAERGAVGGALLFGFLAACLGAGLGARFWGLRSEGKAQVGALAAAVACWLAHSQAEWFWQLPAVTLPAVAYLALLASPWRVDEVAAPGDGEEGPGQALRLGGVGVAVLALTVVIPLYAADHYLNRSYAATDPAEALVQVEQAQKLNPLAPHLPEREAELAAEIGDWDRAKDAYGRTIQLNPEHYAPYMYLATFYERRGELEEALFYYQKALTLNPLDDELDQKVSKLQSAGAG